MPIKLYTFKNWNMLRFVFDYGILNEVTNTYTVWIDLEFHKHKIEKIAKVNEYLASIIKEQAILSTCITFEFNPKPPMREHVRYGKLHY